MHIPSDKYKSKQMFEKIGQVKHYLSLVCISAIVYFVAVLTRTMKGKAKTFLSDYRIAGPVGCRNIGLSE
jgi:hypothetical protein